MSTEDLNDYLKKHDISIGQKTVFFDAKNTFVDTQRPWMLEIGDHCKITRTNLSGDDENEVLAFFMESKYSINVATAPPFEAGTGYAPFESAVRIRTFIL